MSVATQQTEWQEGQTGCQGERLKVWTRTCTRGVGEIRSQRERLAHVWDIEMQAIAYLPAGTAGPDESSTNGVPTRVGSVDDRLYGASVNGCNRYEEQMEGQWQAKENV